MRGVKAVVSKVVRATLKLLVIGVIVALVMGSISSIVVATVRAQRGAIPTLEWTINPGGWYKAGDTITAEATATAEDPSYVESAKLYRDGSLVDSKSGGSTVHTLTVSNSTVAPNTDNATIEWYAEAVVYDAIIGDTRTLTIDATSHIDAQAPSGSIQTPQDGTQVRGVVNITVNYSDTASGVVKVEYYVDDILVRTDQFTQSLSGESYWNWDTTSYSDGTHSIYAKIYDYVGYVYTTSEITVVVDNTEPDVQFVDPTNGSYVKGGITIKVDASDNLVGMDRVEFYCDGNLLGSDDSAPYELFWDTTTVSDGPHNLSAVAYDKVGNSNITEISITVDNNNPSVAITSPTGTYVRGTVSVNVSADDSTSGIEKVEYYINNNLVYTDTSAPYSYSWDTTGYSDGAYTVKVVGYDLAGNTATDTKSYVVDNTQPDVTVVFDKSWNVSGDLYVRDGTYINVSAYDDNGISQILVYIDGTQVDSSTTDTLSYLWDTTTYGDGPHNVTIKTTDNAGNEDVKIYTVYIDNTAPDDFDLKSPADGYATNSLSITFEWYATTDSGSGFDHYMLKIWNSSWTYYVNLTTNKTTESLSVNDGTYNWTVYAYDAVGNEKQALSVWQFTIDTTGAAFTLTVSWDKFSPNGDGILERASIRAQTTDSSSVYWYVAITKESDNSTVRTYKPPYGSSFQWDWYGDDNLGDKVADGRYVVWVYADDGVGNNVSQNHIVTVDTTPPDPFQKNSVNDLGNNSKLNDPSPVFSWSGSMDALTELEEYILIINNTPDLWKAQYIYYLSPTTTSYRIPDNLTDGDWYWWVLARDTAYNYRVADGGALWNGTDWVTTKWYWKFTVDTTPPQILTASVEPYWYSPNGDGRNEKLYINASSNEQLTWSVSILTMDDKEVFNFPMYSGSIINLTYEDYPSYGDGTYKVVISATDDAGNTNSTTIYFVVDTTPLEAPNVLSPQNDEYIGSQLVEFNWTAPSNMTQFWKDELIVYDSLGNPIWNATLTSPQGGYFYTDNTFSDGTYMLKIFRYDKAGNLNSTAYIVFHVDTTPPSAPELKQPPNNGITNSSYVNFTWDASSDASPVIYTLRIYNYNTHNLDFEFTTNNTWYVVNFTSVTGTYVFYWNVSARDLAGNENISQETFVYTIDHTPPQINISVSDQYISPNGDGRKDTVTISGSVVGGDDLQVEWTVRIINSTGQVAREWQSLGALDSFQWDWDGKDENGSVVPDGIYNITVIAKDRAGNQARKYAEVTVDTVAPTPPTITAPVNGTCLNSSEVSISWTWVDTDFAVAKIYIKNQTDIYYYQNISLSDTNITISLPEDRYVVFILVEDVAGNRNFTSFVHFLVDTTPPAILNATAQPQLSADGNITVYINYTDNLSGVAKIEYSFSADFSNSIIINATSAFDVHVDTEGVHVLYIRVYDLAGFPSAVYSLNFTVDLNPPWGGIEVANNTGGNVTFSIWYDDNISGVAYMQISLTPDFSNATWIPANNTYSMTFTQSGYYTVYIRFMDNAGHISQIYSTSFIVDVTPPTLDFSIENATEDNGTYYYGDGNVTLLINATDDNGVEKMRIVVVINSTVVLDTGWITYATIYSFTLTETGNYTITVYVQDTVGAESNVTKYLYLDISPPTINGIDYEKYVVFNNTVNVTVNASDDNSAVAEYGYEFNGTVFWFNSSSFAILLPNAEGDYTITILVKDVWGHVATAQIWIYEVRHRPTGSITTDTNLTNNATVVFYLSATDPVFSIVGMWVKVDSGDWKYYNYTTEIAVDFITDGQHTVYVKFVTELGVESEIYSASIVVDTTPPVSQITTSLPEYTNATEITFDIGGSDTLSGIAYFKVYYRIDGGSWIYLGTYLPNQTAVTLPFGREGVYDIAVVAYDKAGNHEDVQVKATVIVDWTAPTVKITSQPETLTLTFNYTVNFTYSDANGVAHVYIYVYSNGALIMQIDATGLTNYTLTLEDNRTYQIIVVVVDNAGNENNATVEVTVDYNYPPYLRESDIPQNITAGEEITFYAVAEDVKGDEINYTWLLDNETVGYGQYLKIKISDVGNHTLTLVISDGVHAVSYSWNLTVNKAPASTAPPSVGGGGFPWWLIVLLVIIILIVLLIILLTRKGKPVTEEEEGLSEYEMEILNKIKEYLESHGGSAERSKLIDAVSKQLDVSREDVKMVLGYAQKKGVVAVEVDDEGIAHVNLIAKTIELKEKGGDT